MFVTKFTHTNAIFVLSKGLTFLQSASLTNMTFLSDIHVCLKWRWVKTQMIFDENLWVDPPFQITLKSLGSCQVQNKPPTKIYVHIVRLFCKRKRHQNTVGIWNVVGWSPLRYWSSDSVICAGRLPSQHFCSDSVWIGYFHGVSAVIRCALATFTVILKWFGVDWLLSR
jgi:hypothetical protein